MASGYIALVLHCHLPYVRHPEHEEFLEEDWLFQAVTETYVPLLMMFERLKRDGVPFKITLSITPTLCEMLEDSLLQKRCVRYIERRRELLEKEVVRTAGTPYHAAAQMYREHFRRVGAAYIEQYNCDLLERFSRLECAGYAELIASPATHALLPLMVTESARAAQVEAGCRNFEKHFGHRPKAMWLPELAYEPGLEETLCNSGLESFFLETHAALLARPAPKAGIFRPLRTPAGPVAFARDVESSRQVWSAQEGYPGDPDYREFYRDLGYDADYDYIRPYLHPDGVRRNLGIKYHRITGDVPLGQKAPYDPGAAARRAEQHAEHFLAARKEQIRCLYPYVGGDPLIVAPYDAELFGHRWLEGIKFLETFFRKAATDGREVRFTTPSQYIRENPRLQVCSPAASSWGDGGYFEVWLNGSNDWIYPHLHEAEERMVCLASTYAGADGLSRRALNQCARELMLAQSSDWAFLMTVKSSQTYAAERVRAHIARFNALYDQIRCGHVDEAYLASIEAQDNIFREIDHTLYRGYEVSVSP